MTEGVFIHPGAIVETSMIGEGTRIWAFAHVFGGAVIGKNCNIGEHCYIESDVVIGDDVVVKNGVCIWDKVRVEDKVFLGPNMVFTNDRLPRSKAVLPDFVLEDTVVREGASIGANATVLCDIEIGRYAMVGAGAVVTKHVPDYTLVIGNPAVPHGYICVCTKQLLFSDLSTTCLSCGRKYLLYKRYKQLPHVVLCNEDMVPYIIECS